MVTALMMIAVFIAAFLAGLVVGHAIGYHNGWWERHEMPCPNDFKH